jgi:hypothetical protein
LYVLPLALMIYALIDCAQDDDVERTSVPKALWIILVIILPYFGPIAWFAVSKIARPPLYRMTPFFGRPRPPLPGYLRRSGHVAPDDDPDFLRKLDEQTRGKRPGRRQDRQDPPAPGPDGHQV